MNEPLASTQHTASVRWCAQTRMLALANETECWYLHSVLTVQLFICARVQNLLHIYHASMVRYLQWVRVPFSIESRCFSLNRWANNADGNGRLFVFGFVIVRRHHHWKFVTIHSQQIFVSDYSSHTEEKNAFHFFFFDSVTRLLIWFQYLIIWAPKGLLGSLFQCSNLLHCFPFISLFAETYLVWLNGQHSMTEMRNAVHMFGRAT